jgi:hypothetical protein
MADRERLGRAFNRTMHNDRRRSRHCPFIWYASACGYVKRSYLPSVAAYPQLPKRVTRLDAPEERRERQVTDDARSCSTGHAIARSSGTHPHADT